MPRYDFLGTGVDTSAKDVPALVRMIEDAEPMERAEFLACVDTDMLGAVEAALGYGPHLRMESDYCVSYHRSEWEGRPAVFFRQSAIEYIWVLGGEEGW